MNTTPHSHNGLCSCHKQGECNFVRALSAIPTKHLWCPLILMSRSGHLGQHFPVSEWFRNQSCGITKQGKCWVNFSLEWETGDSPDLSTKFTNHTSRSGSSASFPLLLPFPASNLRAFSHHFPPGLSDLSSLLRKTRSPLQTWYGHLDTGDLKLGASETPMPPLKLWLWTLNHSEMFWKLTHSA